jgi:hypothetical protein
LICLEELALLLLASSLCLVRLEDCANALGESRVDILAGESRDLKVLNSADGLCDRVGLLESDGLGAALSQTGDNSGVVVEILLGADHNDGDVRAVVLELGIPLAVDVVERCGRNNRVAEQEAVGLRIRERTKTIVVILTGGIPETEVDYFAIDLGQGRVVIEDGGNVLKRESILSVRAEKASLADRAIANDDDLHMGNVAERGGSHDSSLFGVGEENALMLIR